MRRLGNKVAARNLAIEIGVPVVPATDPLPDDMDEVKKLAAQIGYPLMLKASWGGGGRGMRAIRAEADLAREVMEAKREAKAAFGRMKFISKSWWSVPAMSKCRYWAIRTAMRSIFLSVTAPSSAVTRRSWSARCTYLNDAQRRELADYGLKIAHATDYIGAGTVEFLMDADTGKFYFIEVNPRIQVEHTVTEEVTGIDIVRGADPYSGRLCHRHAGIRACRAGGYPPQWPRAAMPHHNGRPGTEFHPRLRAHSRPIVRRRASASVSMAARPIRAHSSPVITTRFW